MALKIGYAIASGIFNLKDAEEPFHPWWEAVQDYVCYSTILIGRLKHVPRGENMAQIQKYIKYNIFMECF